MHAEIGTPEYRPFTQKMIASFKTVAKPGDRLIQFADLESPALEGVDDVVRAGPIGLNNIMLARIGMLREFFRNATGHIVLSDADMLWHKNPGELFDEDFDIGVTWRVGSPAMPYLGGMIFARQGSEAALHFIMCWYGLASTLPKVIKGWWGDQITLAFMLGEGKPHRTMDWHGVRVKMFDSGRIIHNVRWPDQPAPEGTYATHYKGAKKDLRVS